MELYCYQHRVNHHLTGSEAEDLIQGLFADLADTAVARDDERPDAGADPVSLMECFCPLDRVRLYRDGEMYAEHLEQMRECLRHCGSADSLPAGVDGQSRPTPGRADKPRLGLIRPPYPQGSCADDDCRKRLTEDSGAYVHRDLTTDKLVVLCGDCSELAELVASTWLPLVTL